MRGVGVFVCILIAWWRVLWRVVALPRRCALWHARGEGGVPPSSCPVDSLWGPAFVPASRCLLCVLLLRPPRWRAGWVCACAPRVHLYVYTAFFPLHFLCVRVWVCVCCVACVGCGSARRRHADGPVCVGLPSIACRAVTSNTPAAVSKSFFLLPNKRAWLWTSCRLCLLVSESVANPHAPSPPPRSEFAWTNAPPLATSRLPSPPRTPSFRSYPRLTADGAARPADRRPVPAARSHACVLDTLRRAPAVADPAAERSRYVADRRRGVGGAHAGQARGRQWGRAGGLQRTPSGGGPVHQRQPRVRWGARPFFSSLQSPFPLPCLRISCPCGWTHGGRRGHPEAAPSVLARSHRAPCWL